MLYTLYSLKTWILLILMHEINKMTIQFFLSILLSIFNLSMIYSISSYVILIHKYKLVDSHEYFTSYTSS